MSVDAKQREWVWEFFLKNCNDARMIRELLEALPFPDENLDLKRMLLLRALSLQVSAGSIDELTLAILKGLGELSRVSGARRERHPADISCQEAAKRRKVSEDESNDDEVECSAEATNSSTPLLKDGRVPPAWDFEQRRESGKDAREAEAVVTIRDWMKGRGLPRSVGGSGPAEEQMQGSNLNYGVSSAVNVGTPHGAGDRPGGGEYVFRPGQSAKQWELELAVMLELAVKHLRGDSPDRKSFEHEVTKHWGDSALNDTDGYEPAADCLEMKRVREQIKSELWMVRRYPELLDDVVEKHTKARVEDMLKGYLEKAWVATGQTFLERVSADVINGKYKPVNCNGQRPKKVGSPFADGEAAGQQSNGGKVDTSEKPWIRASRGRYSRSREKQQKNFAIWELDADDARGAAAKLPADETNREGKQTIAEQQAGVGSKRLDRDEDRTNLENKTSDSGEVRPSLSTEGGFETNSRSEKIGLGVKDVSVARVLEFDENTGQEKEEGKQLCQEKDDTVRPDIEATEAAHLLLQTDGNGTLSGGGDDMDVTVCSPVSSAPDIVKAPVVAVSNMINHSEGKEALTADDDEKRTKEAITPKNTDWLGAEPGSPHEVVNKENVVPPSSPKPSDPNPTVCFSPPPWVEGSPAVHVADGIAPGVTRKRQSGSLQGETDAETRGEESRSAEPVAPTDCTNQSPGTTTTQRNLRRKQRVLDAAVQDPLPKILTTRSKGSLLERNATARTVEWDEDEIEESPSNSPSASRQVRLPPTAGKKISPLASSKTSSNVIARQARRKPRRWSEKEVECLKREVGKYGKGRWKLILEKNLEAFQGRTEVDLKDKWRNLERFEGITD